MIYWLKNMPKWKLALSLTLAGVVIGGVAVAIAVPLVLNNKSSDHVNPKHSLPDLKQITNTGSISNKQFATTQKVSEVEDDALAYANSIIKLPNSEKIGSGDVNFLLFDSNHNKCKNVSEHMQDPLSHYFTSNPDTIVFWQLEAKSDNNKVQGITAQISFIVDDQFNLDNYKNETFIKYLSDNTDVLFDWNNTYQDLLGDIYDGIKSKFDLFSDADIGYDDDTTKPLTAEIKVAGNEITRTDYVKASDVGNELELTLTVNDAGKLKYKGTLNVTHEIEKLDLSKAKYDVSSELKQKEYDITTKINTVKTDFANALNTQLSDSPIKINNSDLDVSFSNDEQQGDYVPGGQKISATFSGLSSSNLVSTTKTNPITLGKDGDGDTRYDLSNIDASVLKSNLDGKLTFDNSINDLKQKIVNYFNSVPFQGLASPLKTTDFFIYTTDPGTALDANSYIKDHSEITTPGGGFTIKAQDTPSPNKVLKGNVRIDSITLADTKYDLSEVNANDLHKVLNNKLLTGNCSIGGLKEKVVDYLVNSNNSPFKGSLSLSSLGKDDIDICNNSSVIFSETKTIGEYPDITTGGSGFIIKASTTSKKLKGQKSINSIAVSTTYNLNDHKTDIKNELKNYFFTWNTNTQPNDKIIDRMRGLLHNLTGIDTSKIKDDEVTISLTGRGGPRINHENHFDITFAATGDYFESNATVEYSLSGKYDDSNDYILGNDNDPSGTSDWYGKIWLPYVFHQLLETKKISFTKNDNLRDIFDNSIFPALKTYAPQQFEMEFDFNDDATISLKSTGTLSIPSYLIEDMFIFSNFTANGSKISRWDTTINSNSFTVDILLHWRKSAPASRPVVGEQWLFSGFNPSDSYTINFNFSQPK